MYEYVCIVSVCVHAYLCRPEMNIRCLPQLLFDLIFFISFACIGKDIVIVHTSSTNDILQESVISQAVCSRIGCRSVSSVAEAFAC